MVHFGPVPRPVFGPIVMILRKNQGVLSVMKKKKNPKDKKLLAMASTLVSQALRMATINHAQVSPPKKPILGVSPPLFCASSIKTRVSVTRGVSMSNYVPPTALPAKRGFIVRAESDSAGEADNVDQELGASSIEDADAREESPVNEAKPPRNHRIKLGDIMGLLNKRAVEAAEKERSVPDIRTGDVLEIKLEVPENKRRLSIYKGIVMSRQNAGIHTTIRIRRIVAGVGVEIVFPLYSPNIKEIKVLKHRKVRRARLYYLRDKLPRFSTFK